MRGVALAILLALAACAPAEERLRLLPTSIDALEGWHKDDQAAALAAFRRSCEAMGLMQSGSMVGKGALATRAEIWQGVCERTATVPDKEARAFFEREFVPVAIAGDKGREGLFTGYYEPLLQGSRKRSDKYRYPVYRLPSDVVSGAPYLTRAEIDAGALAHRKLEIAWVDDAAALFFMQIQGSGRIRLAGGKTIRVGYAGKNNQPYVALGKVLIDDGEMTADEVNMFSLKRWLKEHPKRAREMMQRNPSYVFFRELPATDGPIGAQGVALTAKRSLAVDKRYIPYGMPVFVETTLPDERAFHRLMIAQDTGGAIRGTVRGDIFFGAGKEAEQLAGHMKGRGQFSVLVPKEIARDVLDE